MASVICVLSIFTFLWIQTSLTFAQKNEKLVIRLPPAISFMGQTNEPHRRRDGDGNDRPACRRIISAIAVFTTFTPPMKDIKGAVTFTRSPSSNGILLSFKLQGLQPNTLHGCHIHQFGNLTNVCDAAGAHFNPNNVTHGSPSLPNRPRHVGDIIANLTADAAGAVDLTYELALTRFDGAIETPSLCGDNSIVGRTLVIHANPDDGGVGTAATSNTTGNSGPRIACGIIGIGNDELPKQSKFI